MATAEPAASVPRAAPSPKTELADQWRTLTRAATFVAVLTSPALFVWFHQREGWSVLWSLAATVGLVVASRGLVDLLFRRLIPWPSLFGADSEQLRDEDVMARRRVWFWKFWIKAGITITLVVLGASSGKSSSSTGPSLVWSVADFMPRTVTKSRAPTERHLRLTCG